MLLRPKAEEGEASSDEYQERDRSSRYSTIAPLRRRG
jgi:hypothetical protein